MSDRNYCLETKTKTFTREYVVGKQAGWDGTGLSKVPLARPASALLSASVPCRSSPPAPTVSCARNPALLSGNGDDAAGQARWRALMEDRDGGADNEGEVTW